MLLNIWFIVSYGCVILFRDALNKIRFGGFKHQNTIFSKDDFKVPSTIDDPIIIDEIQSVFKSHKSENIKKC
ncbi:MAG: DUF4212 domain-containing protein [Flavobacteriaceae bacterium]|nr:DUF4212 domain-containing protein [Flavobacteriaceae bacterium]